MRQGGVLARFPLPGPHLRVGAVAREQRRVGAAFDDAPLLQDENLVGVDHRGQPVCDHQRRPVSRYLPESDLNFPFGAGVERRGGLVEHQDAGALENRPGDRHALLLAARELEPAFADHRLVAVRHRHDLVVDRGCARGRLDLGRRRVGSAVGDIVIDGIVEQHGVLRDDPDRGADARLGDAPDVLAVDGDLAVGHVVEPVEQARQGRFPGTRRPHYGDAAPGRDGEAHVVQDAAARIVTERDVAEDDLSRPVGERPGKRSVLHLGLDAEEVEHRFHVGQRLLDLAIDEAEITERQIELDEIGVDHDEIADRHRAFRHAVARHQHHPAEAAADDKRLSDVEQRQRGVAGHRRPLVATQRRIEAARLIGLVAEILDGLVVEQAVDRPRVRFLVGLVHAPAVFQAPLGDDHRVGHESHDGAERHQREPEIEQGPQDDADHRQFEQRRQDVEQREAEQEIDRLGAAFDRPRQPAGLAVEMEAEREPVQVAEGRERDLADRPLADLGEDRVAEFPEGGRQHPDDAVAEDHADGHDRQRLAVRAEDIHRLLVEDRDVDGGDLGKREEAQRHRDPDPDLERAPGPEIGQQRSQSVPLEAVL